MSSCTPACLGANSCKKVNAQGRITFLTHTPTRATRRILNKKDSEVIS